MAIDKGFNNPAHIKTDTDLDFIRNSKEFQEIIDKLIPAEKPGQTPSAIKTEEK